MKKLFGIIAVVLLSSSVVFAGTRLLDETQIKGSDGGIKFTARTICVDDYKFVVVRTVVKYDKTENQYDTSEVKEPVGIGVSVTTTQFYENQNGKAVPARC